MNEQELFVFRTHSREGIGSGDSTHRASSEFPAGDQYIAASKELVDKRVLPDVIRWFSLDSASRDHTASKDDFVAWSFVEQNGYLYVVRLCPFGTFGEKRRASYFAQGRVLKVGRQFSVNPLFLLGDHSQYERPWRYAEERKGLTTEAGLSSLSSERFCEIINSSRDKALTIELAELLLIANQKKKNVVLAVSMTSLTKDANFTSILALAAALLPPLHTKSLSVRIFSRHGIDTFVSHTENTVLVIPRDEYGFAAPPVNCILVELVDSRLVYRNAAMTELAKPWDQKGLGNYMNFVFKMLEQAGLVATTFFTQNISIALESRPSDLGRSLHHADSSFCRAMANLALRKAYPKSSLSDQSELFNAMMLELGQEPSSLLSTVLTNQNLQLFDSRQTLLPWLIQELSTVSDTANSQIVWGLVARHLNASKTDRSLVLDTFADNSFSQDEALRSLDRLLHFSLLDEAQINNALRQMSPTVSPSPKFPDLYAISLKATCSHEKKLPSVEETHCQVMLAADELDRFLQTGEEILEIACTDPQFSAQENVESMINYCQDGKLISWISSKASLARVVDYLHTQYQNVQATELLQLLLKLSIKNDQSGNKRFAQISWRLERHEKSELKAMGWHKTLSSGEAFGNLYQLVNNNWNRLPIAFLTSFADLIYDNKQIWGELAFSQKEAVIQSIAAVNPEAVYAYFEEIDSLVNCGQLDELVRSPLLRNWYEWHQQNNSTHYTSDLLLNLMCNPSKKITTLTAENWDWLIQQYKAAGLSVLEKLQSSNLAHFSWVDQYQEVQVKHLIDMVENNDRDLPLIKKLVALGGPEAKVNVSKRLAQVNPKRSKELVEDSISKPEQLTKEKIESIVDIWAEYRTGGPLSGKTTTDIRRLEKQLTDIDLQKIYYSKMRKRGLYSSRMGAPELRNFKGDRDVFWLYQGDTPKHYMDVNERQFLIARFEEIASRLAYELETDELKLWKELASQPHLMSDFALYLRHDEVLSLRLPDAQELLTKLNKANLLFGNASGLLLSRHSEIPVHDLQLCNSSNRQYFFPFIRLFQAICEAPRNQHFNACQILLKAVDKRIKFKDQRAFNEWCVSWRATFYDRVDSNWTIPLVNKAFLIACPTPKVIRAE